MLPLSPGSAGSRRVATSAWRTTTSATSGSATSGSGPASGLAVRFRDSHGRVGGSSALRAAVRSKLKPHPQGTGSRFRAERTATLPGCPLPPPGVPSLRAEPVPRKSLESLIQKESVVDWKEKGHLSLCSSFSVRQQIAGPCGQAESSAVMKFCRISLSYV